MPYFDFATKTKKNVNSSNKRGVNNSSFKTSVETTVHDNGNIDIDKVIELTPQQAKDYFDNNLFIKFSFECIKAVTNVDNVGLQLLFSILKKNIVRPTVEDKKNKMMYIVLLDKTAIEDYAEELGFSERHVRNGIKSLIDNAILLQRCDKNGIPVRSSNYILNINFINNLNFIQWYNNVKTINTEYNVNIRYTIKVKQKPEY